MPGIQELSSRLEKLAGQEVKQRVIEKTRDAAHAQVIQEFNEERDPYGTKWAPRKRPPNWAVRAFGLMNENHKLLDKTGKMIGSLTSRASAGARVVMKLIRIAKWHQEGTKKMAARQIFPDQGRGLGLWAEPLYQASVAAIKDIMRK